MTQNFEYYRKQIEDKPENVQRILQEVIESEMPHVLGKLLRYYKEDIETESFRFLYPLAMNIIKFQPDNYKPYINAIYSAGLNLDVSKYNQTMVCNDILSTLYENNRSDVVDYLINHKSYPAVFLNSGNFYDTCCLHKNSQMIEHLISRGFSANERHFLYENLTRDNLSDTFVILNLIHKNNTDFDLEKAYEKLFFASKRTDFSISDYQVILDKSNLDLSKQNLFEWMTIEHKLLSAFYKSKELLEFIESNGFPLKSFIEQRHTSDHVLNSITGYLLSYKYPGITDYFFDNNIHIDLKTTEQIDKFDIFFQSNASICHEKFDTIMKIMHISGFDINGMESRNDFEEQLFNKNFYLNEDTVTAFWLMIEKQTLKNNLSQSSVVIPLKRL